MAVFLPPSSISKEWFPCSSAAKAELAEAGCKRTLDRQDQIVVLPSIFHKKAPVWLFVLKHTCSCQKWIADLS